jgi:hypothetical protein
MAQGNDWVPGREQDLVQLMAKWTTWLSDAAKRTAFGWDTTECGRVVSRIGEFTEALEAYQADDSSVNLLAKNEARKAAAAAIRAFANSSVRFNIKMLDTDRLVLGIRPRDATPSSTGVPTIHVGFTLAIQAVYELQIRFWVLETGKKAVPKNMNGVVVYRKVSDTPITDQEELTKTALLTAHIETLHFEPHERGKMVYVACRWESRTGEEGEWSPIQSFMIP